MRLDEALAACAASSSSSSFADLALDLSAVEPRLAGALPASIGAVVGARLVNLDAPNHLLTAFSAADAAALPRLRTVFFLGNRFEEVPEALGSLAELRMLSLKSCRLGRVVEASLAASLVWLILTDNHIPRLPRSIGALAHLRKLMLASNALEALPDEIGLCGCLELARLSDNRLERVPSGLLALPRLAWLALAGNPMTSAPAGTASASAAAAGPAPRRVAQVDVALGEKLGEGASGAVFCASLDGKDCAAKVFKPISSDGRPEDEISAALALPPHVNLIETLAFYDEASAGGADGEGRPRRLGLVMELVRGSLLGRTPSFDTVTRDTFPPTSAFELSLVRSVARGIAAALAHMHAHGVVHGDLYAHNILVSDEGVPKLGDLGAAFLPPLAMRRAFERLEARAFSCLLEDLLGLPAPTETAAPRYAAPRAALVQLAADCASTDVVARPSFAEIAARLEAMDK